MKYLYDILGLMVALGSCGCVANFAGHFSDHLVVRGTPLACSASDEGLEVPVALISENPCIHCKCQKKVVQCRRETCQLPQGCHFLENHLPTNSCCHLCKSCTLNGTVHSSPSSWHHPKDPCKIFICQSGIITETQQVCHTPCKDPLPPAPGTCCPSCSGCSLKGVSYPEGFSFQLAYDPCIKCKCRNGNITCLKESCPVLPCQHVRMATSPKTCCPYCKGTRKVDYLGGRCLIGSELFDDGSSWPHDQCTTCSCANGTSVCHRTVCPPRECPPEHQVFSPDNCCPRCRSAPQEKKQECVFNSRIYLTGDKWKTNRCTQCTCDNGEALCQAEECAPLVCPPKHIQVKKKGDCCPTCVESDGVCTVFGDPHYKTFDDVRFSYQGQCRYTLVTDECQANITGRSTFSVQVFNDPRHSKHYSWTRAILIRIDNHKIRLGQLMKVKVQRNRVKLPYVLLGDVSVHADGSNVVVRSNKKGFKLTWNGDNYVEVSVPPKLKNSLCGLCGNYNENQDDEYTMKNGKITQDVNEFGNSWKVGHRTGCLKAGKPRQQCRNGDKALRRRNMVECNKLKSATFKACHKHASPMPFFRACLLDMCNCEAEGRCFCDSLHAYSRECSRAGFTIPHWTNATNCVDHQCPRDSEWTECGGVCKKSCKSWNNAKSSCSKRCVPGCACRKGLVWFENRCIEPQGCPVY